MTDERSIRTRYSVSFFAILGLSLFVCQEGSRAGEWSDTQTRAKVATVEQVALSGNPSRFELQAYGDRFKQAMKVAAEEAEKPHWAWASVEEQQAQTIE